tara:strand:+ start:485 stop:769 length:285 start_codon:yes stop_codon:yes gene_type:complete
MKKCSTTHSIAWILVIIGALNWGLVGIGNFLGMNWDLVDLLIGSWSTAIANIVYILVGLSAIMMMVGCKKCKVSPKAAPEQPMGGNDMNNGMQM